MAPRIQPAALYKQVHNILDVLKFMLGLSSTNGRVATFLLSLALTKECI